MKTCVVVDYEQQGRLVSIPFYARDLREGELLRKTLNVANIVAHSDTPRIRYISQPFLIEN